MLSLAVGTVVVLGAVVSGTSWICLRPSTKDSVDPPMSRYTITTDAESTTTAAVQNEIGQIMCQFNLVSNSNVVHNIYRLFGRLAIVNSSAEVALFYRNTVGKGGYIEFFPGKFSEESKFENSLLSSFLSRFQTKMDNPPSARVYILAKLNSPHSEISFEDDTQKLLWCADELKLYAVNGLTRHEAALVTPAYSDKNDVIIPGSELRSNNSSRHFVTVYRTQINPYLAVCVCLYFMLIEKENTDK